MIDGVDKEKDRLCGARSWSLHTDCWSLSTKEGRADGDNCCRIDDDENNAGARGKDDGRRRRPPPADMDKDGMPSS